jgi:hypothetical protein
MNPLSDEYRQAVEDWWDENLDRVQDEINEGLRDSRGRWISSDH